MRRIDLESFEEEWEKRDELPRRAGKRARVASDDDTEARVVSVDKGFVSILVGGDSVRTARFGSAMRGEQLVAGDRVLVTRAAHDEERRVVERLPRETVLTRTPDDALPEERVVVANADRAIVVLAAEDPEGGARFVDRILVAASAGGLAGAVCVNKTDLGYDVADIVDRYEAIGYPVIRASAKTDVGLDDLRELLRGAWSVLTGHSGVGKTSLFNKLVPERQREIGEVGRFGGRHTTVSSLAMPVPDTDDAWLVDTPGVRSFGIGMVAPDELSSHFPELAAVRCELSGCLHDGEPGCAVPDLVGVSVHEARYASYRRLLAALRGDAPI